MLKKYLRSFLDIIYPPCCIVCKRSLKGIASIKDIVCRSCWLKIKKNQPPFCLRCGRYLDNRSSRYKVCNGCIKKQLHFDRAFSPCIYEGVIKELIHKFKYEGRQQLGGVLACLLIEFIKEFNLPPLEYFDMFIPIPLHKNRLREREFNQAQILAEHLSREFKLELCYNNLLRTRNTLTQTDLSEGERLLNVKNSFTLRDTSKIKDKMIILVDDVLTTGATCSEASRILKDNGARTVFVLTVAS